MWKQPRVDEENLGFMLSHENVLGFATEVAGKTRKGISEKVSLGNVAVEDAVDRLNSLGLSGHLVTPEDFPEMRDDFKGQPELHVMYQELEREKVSDKGSIEEFITKSAAEVDLVFPYFGLNNHNKPMIIERTISLTTNNIRGY